MPPPIFRVYQRHFFGCRIHDEDLHAASWDQVVTALVELQRTSRLCIVKDQLTAHDIANRVLRKENYMVAFVNKGLLPILRLPCLPTLDTCTKTLEWNVYAVILDAMFDKEFRIRQASLSRFHPSRPHVLPESADTIIHAPSSTRHDVPHKAFTHDIGGLRRRLFLCGALNLALSPFVAAFMLIFFFLKHAEEFHRRPASSAFSRDYSRYARWTMREFNELPHFFEARIGASAEDVSLTRTFCRAPSVEPHLSNPICRAPSISPIHHTRAHSLPIPRRICTLTPSRRRYSRCSPDSSHSSSGRSQR